MGSMELEAGTERTSTPVIPSLTQHCLASMLVRNVIYGNPRGTTLTVIEQGVLCAALLNVRGQS